MEVHATILTRASVWNYLSNLVTTDQIDRLINAAVHAPSLDNFQVNMFFADLYNIYHLSSVYLSNDEFILNTSENKKAVVSPKAITPFIACV
jgi:hypothetical protein